MTSPSAREWIESARGLQERVRSIPDLSPRDLLRNISRMGYVGQSKAVRRMCVFAHQHIKRIKALYGDREPARVLPPKRNILLTGETGCGKTYLAELLFGQILKIPFVSVDVTRFSETGYVGDNIKTAFASLFRVANEAPEWMSIGVIFLDEFDKLAASGSGLVFAGEGSQKDVSGRGVQKDLLKALECGDVALPAYHGLPVTSDCEGATTRDIAFIAAGVFGGLRGGTRGSRRKIGFHGPDSTARDESQHEPSVTDFARIGFLPELIARFSSIVTFEDLSIPDLKEILRRNMVPQLQRQFRHDGIHLTVEPRALDTIAEKAYRRKVGARGLGNELSALLDDCLFDLYSTEIMTSISVSARDGELQCEIGT